MAHNISAKLNFTNISFTYETTNVLDLEDNTKKIDIVRILSIIIASVGIVSNFTVIVAFLNHKTFRRKIPNIFIINQVSFFSLSHNICFKLRLP